MWIRIKADCPFDSSDWIDLNRPTWEYRVAGRDDWHVTDCDAAYPLCLDVETLEMPARVVVRVMGPDGLVYLNSAEVSDVTHLHRKRPPATPAGDAGMTSITVDVPAVKDPELRDASVPMRWLLGLPAPHLPGGVRWHETQLPACRLTQLLLRVPEEDPTAYLALPGERLAIKIVLPGLPSDCASLSVVALPFAAGVN